VRPLKIKNALGASGFRKVVLIITASNCFEAVLPRGVPNLKLNRLTLQVYRLDFLGNSECGGRESWEVWCTKSTPIVLKKFYVNLFSEYLSSMQDFPTPEFPINSNLKR